MFLLYTSDTDAGPFTGQVMLIANPSDLFMWIWEVAAVPAEKHIGDVASTEDDKYLDGSRPSPMELRHKANSSHL